VLAGKLLGAAWAARRGRDVAAVHHEADAGAERRCAYPWCVTVRVVLGALFVCGALGACSVVMPAPTRELGFLIENRSDADVDFSVGASGDASTVGVVTACTADMLPGVTVQEGDVLAIGGGEIYRFDSLPPTDTGGLRVVIREHQPPVVSVMNVGDRVPQDRRDDLCS
jgi:hypothetical protein